MSAEVDHKVCIEARVILYRGVWIGVTMGDALRRAQGDADCGDIDFNPDDVEVLELDAVADDGQEPQP